MGGKASLILVMGFSMIFLVFGSNFGLLTQRSVDNMTDYYIDTRAYNIAVSGANMVLNNLFLDSEWDSDDEFDNLAFNDGTVTVTLASAGSEKTITSVGTYQSVERMVRVKLQPSSYAKFAWYIGNMSSKIFITGDTIWGPFHSQSVLNIGGSPVFWGKVTSLKGCSPEPDKWAKDGYDPKFYGGLETGVDIPLPVNYQFDEERAAAIDGVDNHGGSSYFENTDVWLEFHNDGTITYRTGTGPDTSSYSAPVTLDLSTFAPNGVIYLKRGDIYMSGTLSGKVTVASGESSGMGNGNIYMVDDMTYTTDPMTWDAGEGNYVPNESCPDMMGILASNNVIIANNDHNVMDRDIHIDGSIFCAQGGLEMEDNTIPESGTVYLRGGAVCAKEELLAQLDHSGNIEHGYKKHVIFDQRFMLQIPPTFPNTGQLEVVSWYE